MKRLSKKVTKQLDAATSLNIQDEPDQARLRLHFVRMLADPATKVASFDVGGGPMELVSITVKIFPGSMDLDWLMTPERDRKKPASRR